VGSVLSAEGNIGCKAVGRLGGEGCWEMMGLISMQWNAFACLKWI
jgi:hypothetical protein